MIDIHAHILPGLDDGPQSMAEALAMARKAVKSRIDTIVATPHVLNGVFVNRAEQIRSACQNFNAALKAEKIDLKVLPGAEVRIHPEMVEALGKGKLMTVNDAGKYLLLEMPEQVIPDMITELIGELRQKEIIPIIAHPERNLSLQKHSEWLDRFVAAGALIQITAGSITGRFGRPAYKTAKHMLMAGAVDLVGSDAHSAFDRIPSLIPAYKKIEKIIGRQETRYIQFEAPEKITERNDYKKSVIIMV